MENIGELEHKNLKKELVKGKELARQLQSYLNAQVPSASVSGSGSTFASSHKADELLVQKILSSFEKALSMLNYGNSSGIQISESPSSLNESPRSEDSLDGNASRKRSIFPTWTQKFKFSPGIALEGSLDDGFCWRKYGQKGILGAKHPRGYYRCTHRSLQGCLATKQVQRSDDDATVFEITYRGNHSCSQICNLTAPLSAPSDFQQPNSGIEKNQQASPDALLNSWPSLRVITENLDTHEPTFSSFNFDSTSNYDAARHVKPVSRTVEGGHAEFSPSFISPAAGQSYFSASSSCLSEGIVRNQILQENKSQLSEVFPPSTSAANSANPGLEFSFGEFEMEPSFIFDNTDFFS